MKRETVTGYGKVVVGNYSAWGYDNSEWMIADEYNTVIAVLKVTTNRERRECWSTVSGFHVVTSHVFSIKVRVGYAGDTVEIDDMIMHGGLLENVKRLLVWVSEGLLQREAIYTLKNKLRALNTESICIMNCETYKTIDGELKFDYDVTMRKLFELLKRESVLQ